jgi:hypothetical protein
MLLIVAVAKPAPRDQKCVVRERLSTIAEIQQQIHTKVERALRLRFVLMIAPESTEYGYRLLWVALKLAGNNPSAVFDPRG